MDTRGGSDDVENTKLKQIGLACEIGGILLALFLSVSGCLLAQIHQLDPGQTLTPEQIKAYRELNMDVYGCFQIGGPPPAGNTVWIVAPKDSKTPPKFGDNCHVIS